MLSGIPRECTRLQRGSSCCALIPGGWVCAVSSAALALVAASSLLDSASDNKLVLDVTVSKGIFKAFPFPQNHPGQMRQAVGPAGRRRAWSEVPQQQMDETRLVPWRRLPQRSQPWLTLRRHVPATKGTGCPWPSSRPSAAWPAVTFCRGDSPLPAQKLRGEAKGKLNLGWGEDLSTLHPAVKQGLIHPTATVSSWCSHFPSATGSCLLPSEFTVC